MTTAIAFSGQNDVGSRACPSLALEKCRPRSRSHLRIERSLLFYQLRVPHSIYNVADSFGDSRGSLFRQPMSSGDITFREEVS